MTIDRYTVSKGMLMLSSTGELVRHEDYEKAERDRERQAKAFADELMQRKNEHEVELVAVESSRSAAHGARDAMEAELSRLTSQLEAVHRELALVQAELEEYKKRSIHPSLLT